MYFRIWQDFALLGVAQWRMEREMGASFDKEIKEGKVCGCYAVTFLNPTPRFDSYVLW
jgi:hypothetical protein